MSFLSELKTDPDKFFMWFLFGMTLLIALGTIMASVGIIIDLINSLPRDRLFLSCMAVILIPFTIMVQFLPYTIYHTEIKTKETKNG